MDIQEIKTGIRNVTIYPNPISDEMIIRATDFQHNKIEILDVMGKLISSRATAGETVLHLTVNLSDGMYFVKISNEMHYQLKKFMVANN